MKKHLLLSSLAFVMFASSKAQMVTDTFFFTGSQQTFVVPSDVDSMVIDIRGSAGESPTGGANGGMGGLVYGNIDVTPGEILYIYVGGINGYNGGGSGGSCGGLFAGKGGGATDIRRGGTGLNNRFAVAGGGGGGAKGTCCSAPVSGGGGGGISGNTCGCSGCGGGGTQSAGGTAGSGSFSGTDGNIGSGGDGGIYNCTNNYGFGGGGGGGYYGGGGGNAMSTSCGSNNSPAGGGGGSSLVPTGCSTTSGYQSGDGMIIIGAYRCSVSGTFVYNGTTTAATCIGCADGIIDINVTQFYPPLTYIWNTGDTTEDLTNITAGNYYATVTNSVGCQLYPFFIITQPAPVTNLYFQKTFGGANFDYAEDVKSTSDGGFIVGGYTQSYGAGNEDAYLLKLDANGNREWFQTYGGTGQDRAYSVHQTSDGGYIFVGQTYITSVGDKLYCVRTDSVGSIVWSKYYSDASTWSYGYSIFELHDGGFIIGGIHNTYGITYKIDANGNIVWTPRQSPFNQTQNESVQECSDNGFIAAGAYASSPGQLLLSKYDSLVTNLWYKVYYKSGNGIFTGAKDVKELSGGGFIVAGYTNGFGSGGYDLVLLKTSITGSLIWAKTYGGSGDDYAESIKQTPDGGFIVTGKTFSFGSGGYDVYLIKTDANGNVQWAKTYGGADYDEGYSVDIHQSDSGYVITGYTGSFGAGIYDIYLVKTDIYGNSGGCNENDVTANTVVSVPAFLVSSGQSNGNTVSFTTTTSTSAVNSLTTTDSVQCFTQFCNNLSATPNIIGESACGANDGIAGAIVSGGTSPFGYLWSTGDTSQYISSLSAGIYNCTVTDNNNCKVTVAASVPGFTPPTITLTGVNPSTCGGSNGTVILSISGGASPFIYQWNTGTSSASLTGRLAGVYAVSITDANGCLVSGSATLNDPSSLSIIVTSTDDTICGGSNGTATVTATGGSTPYQYQWSNGATTSFISNLPSQIYSITVTDNVGCARTSYAVINAPQSLILTSATTQANCNVADGSATITASGGTNPYIYHWSNGSTNSTNDSLTAGIYVVTVTDSLGCSGSTAVPVSNSSGLTVVPSVNNATCYGGSNGSISLSVSGGATPYTYSWSNGSTATAITNLSAGPYEIIVTDADTCLVTQTINVSQPAPITVIINTSAATCGTTDGSASATLSGGASPYAYSWSSGGTTSVEAGLGAGIYAVQVNDSNGCIALASAAIGEIGAPVISNAALTPQTCGSSGGSINILVSGGTPPYGYNWSNGAISEDIYNLNSGTYTVTVTGSNGCKAISSYNLQGIQPQLQPVCLVTTDPNNNNVVVYERVQQTGISHYNIYRETTQSGVYNLAATIPFSQLSQFTDVNSNAQVRSYRYKIGAVDTCGNESLHSPPHQTIHLTANLGVGNVVNLVWNHYNGFSFSTYYIWRFKQGTGWVTIDSLASNLNSYTDTTTGTGNVQYFVEAKPGFTCTSVIKSENHNSSRSNIKLTSIPGSTLSASVNTTPDGGSCNGTATATPNGGQSPYTYSWSSNASTTATATGLCAGNYTVSVTDVSGDFAVQNFTISVCPAPVADFAATQTSGNAPLSVDFFDMSANSPDSLLWTFFGATPLNSTLINPTAITYNTVGTFSVKLEVFNSCGSNIIIKNGFITVSSSGGSTLTATATATADSGSCNGTATVIANGGITPYTYLWNDSAATASTTASNLCTGIYSVTITEAGGNSYSVTVQVPYINTCLAPVSDFAASQTSGNAPLTIDYFDLTTNNPDSIKWTFFGGNPQTSILQNPSGIIYSSPGTYSVKLESFKNCGNDIEIKSGYITVNSSGGSTLTATATATADTNGQCIGTATVIANGGTTPYTYLWSDSTSSATAANLCAGVYSVTITDGANNNYVSTLQVSNVNTCVPPVADFTASPVSGAAPLTIGYFDLSLNNPDSVKWTFFGGSPLNSTQQNPTGIVYSTAGIYTVKLEAFNTCGTDVEIKSNYITVNACASPVADFAASQISGNAPLTVDFFDLTSNAPDSVSWTFFGATPLNSIIQNPTGITYNNAGTYSIKLQSYNNCGNDIEIKSGYITVLLGVEVEELNVSDFDFQIYPNPNDGTFTIELRSSDFQLPTSIKIYNVLGEIVYQTTLNRKPETINLKQPNGIYNVQVVTSNSLLNKKVVIE